MRGTVERIELYGAFIDIDGFSALLHISEISEARLVPGPEQVFTVGDQVTAMVRGAEPERGRVSLSTKMLERNAGDMVRDPRLVYENAEAAASEFRRILSEGSI